MSTIKKLTPKKGLFKQGYYEPLNPHKYIGDVKKIIYRSSWELKFMQYLDRTGTIIEWSSEPIGIPYTHPFKPKILTSPHLYYPDFYVKTQTEDGEIIESIVEIKPKEQYAIQPELIGKKSMKKLKKYNELAYQYILNRVKFEAAHDFCTQKRWNFIVVDEDFFVRL